MIKKKRKKVFDLSKFNQNEIFLVIRSILSNKNIKIEKIVLRSSRKSKKS